MNKIIDKEVMEDRIKIGNDWYVKEARVEIDPTTFRGCSYGRYTFNVLTRHEDEIWKETGWVDTTGVTEMMDNTDFLRDFRDFNHDESLMSDTSYSDQEDLRALLIYVTDLGWLDED